MSKTYNKKNINFFSNEKLQLELDFLPLKHRS